MTTDPAIWAPDAGWPVIARLIGGRWLGNLIAVAGLVSMWTLLNAQLLYTSRLPYVMACDGWLPQVFAQAAPDTAVPKAAIILFSVLTAVLSAISFGGLAVIQCVLYAGALSLELLALIVVRIRREQGQGDVFRIPWGWWGIGYTCITPLAFTALVLYATLRDWRSYPGQLFIVAAVVASGVGLYLIRRRAAAQLASPASAIVQD